MTLPEVSQLYRQAMAMDPENVFFVITYADFCFQNGLVPQGEQHYLKAAELDPDNAAMIYSDLAFGYMNTGMKFLERLQQINPDTTKYNVMEKAIQYTLKGLDIESDEAVKLCKEMIEAKPELVENKPGEMSKIEGDADGKEMLNILKKEPGNPFLLMQIGMMAFDMGLTEAGEYCYIEATKSDPSQARFFYNDLKMSYWFAVKEKGEPDAGCKKKALFFGLKALRVRPEDLVYIITGESIEK